MKLTVGAMAGDIKSWTGGTSGPAILRRHAALRHATGNALQVLRGQSRRPPPLPKVLGSSAAHAQRLRLPRRLLRSRLRRRRDCLRDLHAALDK